VRIAVVENRTFVGVCVTVVGVDDDDLQDTGEATVNLKGVLLLLLLVLVLLEEERNRAAFAFFLLLKLNGDDAFAAVEEN